MQFLFDTKITETDYYKFNLFMNFKSFYGKKQLVKALVSVGIFFVIFSVLVLVTNGVNRDALVRISGALALLAGWVLLSFVIVMLILKARMKKMKKTGKLLYSPQATIEFYDDRFVEMTDENKTENKYTAIDRVSILKREGTVYIHMNALVSHIIPKSSFENDGQFNEFAEFVKTKCNGIDLYK